MSAMCHPCKLYISSVTEPQSVIQGLHAQQQRLRRTRVLRLQGATVHGAGLAAVQAPAHICEVLGAHVQDELLCPEGVNTPQPTMGPPAVRRCRRLQREAHAAAGGH